MKQFAEISAGGLPEWRNIGAAACDRHADRQRPAALIYEAPDGKVERSASTELKLLSNRCANALAAMGVGPAIGSACDCRNAGTAIAHLAIYKLGAVALPLFTQFGPEALEHRLGDSGARALITDGENLANDTGPARLELRRSSSSTATAAVIRCFGRASNARPISFRRRIPGATIRPS